MNDKWKIVPKKIIYKSKLFSVEEDEITLPNNKKKKYDVVKRLSTAIIFPITPSYELYLISEFRTLHGKNMIEAIAGHIDKGESPIVAAKRELKEEAGLTGDIWEEMVKIEASSSVIKSTGHLFMVKNIEEGEPSPDEGEEITLLKMPLYEAVKKVMLGEINISTTVIGILLLDKLRREGKL